MSSDIVHNNNSELILSLSNSDTKNINDSLQVAIQSNNQELVTSIIELLKNNFDSNRALLTAVKCRNQNLINYFIKLGADNWNGAMYEAINDLDLVKFFVDRGASNFQGGLNIASYYGGLVLIKYFVEKLGNNANYGFPLSTSLEGGDYELINFILDQEPIIDCQIYSLGPLLRDLIAKTKLQTKDGKDYSTWFPFLINEGYICGREVLASLHLLYLLQNDLLVGNDDFTMSDTLISILIKHPALHEIEHTLPGPVKLSPNTKLINTVEVLKQTNEYYSILYESNRIIPMTVWPHIIMTNYEPSFISEHVDTHEIIRQLKREHRLLLALIDTYDH